jgi:hypothetical protein
METPVLVLFTSLFIVLFFMVGAIIGWLVNRHVIEMSPLNLHPEMFDSSGNIIPDEVLAVRFEEGFFDDEQEES